MHDDLAAVPDDDDYAQGAWEAVRAAPRRVAGRKDGRSPDKLLDVAAFSRLLKILERPIDERPGESE